MLDYATGVIGCIISTNTEPLPVLIHELEYLKTAGNISDLNKVYLGFHEGLQYSVLGPAHIPDDLDFQATSYGSHTECNMVTTQCGAVSVINDPELTDVSESLYNFVCNNTMAGLNMTGNFFYLGEEIESYTWGINNESDTENPIENVNTMYESDFSFGFQYFNDSAKQIQVPQLDNYGLGTVEHGPITNITSQYFWAFAFSLLYFDNTTENLWAGLNLVGNGQGGADGIMSCKTNISEIVCLVTALFPCPYLHIIVLLISLRYTLTARSLPLDL